MVCGRFKDRREAGRRLAARLKSYQGEDAIVLALPRGGVPVGFEIASALDVPLDVLVVRKLGAPGQPELGIGAIAPGGVRIVEPRTVALLGITEAEIETIAGAEMAELERRLCRLRGDAPMARIAGRTVIIADDGVATGVTTRAAIRAVRERAPRRVVLAVPVCAAESTAILRAAVDDFICLTTPAEFVSVSSWYATFDQTTDEEVVALLARRRDPTGAGMHVEGWARPV